MPRRANQTSFKAGINPKTGQPAMTDVERKLREKEYYIRHKPKLLRRNWKTQIGKCGWTPEEYHAAFTKQSGVCFICLGTDKRKLSADHCHKTGERRHLLCNRCNQVLGLAGDNRELLIRMEKYLCQAVE